MNEAPIPPTVYIDQNVISALQAGHGQRESTLKLLDDLRGNTPNSAATIFVYSSTHVDECRASNAPEAFVDMIESISARYLEPVDPKADAISLSPNRARELILGDTDFADAAKRVTLSLLRLPHFASGWLGKVQAHDIHKELIEEIDLFWEKLERELPAEFFGTFDREKESMVAAINRLNLQNIQGEEPAWQDRVKQRLPANLAQLDGIPAREVVTFLLTCLDEKAQEEIRNTFPPGFWAAFENREVGHLSGFAFLLFLIGLVRDRRIKRGANERRAQHFRGQFRDCEHIEHASRCSAFLTFDEGAARLASAVYAYAGVRTLVVSREKKRGHG